jgi:membrane protein required for colicin V production
LSAFDLVAAAVIAVCALLGYQRGAVREIVGLVAFAASAVAAIAILPVSVGIAGTWLHPRLLAVVAAVIAGFVLVYVALKLIGHLVATTMHKQALLGGADRSLGLMVGAVRALVLIGLFTLVFDRATPTELKPRWITAAFLYPLAQASGRTIATVAPIGQRMLAAPGALLKAAGSPDEPEPAEAAESPAPVAKPAPVRPAVRKGRGYDLKSREQLDKLLERNR